jgi:hypothetical protein
VTVTVTVKVFAEALKPFCQAKFLAAPVCPCTQKLLTQLRRDSTDDAQPGRHHQSLRAHMHTTHTHTLQVRGVSRTALGVKTKTVT